MMRLITIIATALCLTFCGCAQRAPVDKDGRRPEDVFRQFLKAVEDNDVEKARSFWSGSPNIANGGGRGDFMKDVFDWWKGFDEVRIKGTYKGKAEYWHVVTECYKNGKKEAWPEPALFLEKDVWKIARNIWWWILEDEYVTPRHT